MGYFDREVRNAQIESTMLGVEDHGIFTAWLHLKWTGGGQGFGGYAMDEYNKSTKQRVATEFGAVFIIKLLDTVGVSSWEKLKGQYVRMDADHSRVYRIGNLLKDKWFDPEELARQYNETNS